MYPLISSHEKHVQRYMGILVLCIYTVYIYKSVCANVEGCVPWPAINFLLELYPYVYTLGTCCGKHCIHSTTHIQVTGIDEIMFVSFHWLQNHSIAIICFDLRFPIRT